MWYFSAVALPIVFGFWLWRKLGERWGGKETSHGGRDFLWRVTKHKGSITGTYLGIPAKGLAHFKIYEEAGRHRFAKAVGIAQEIQTGEKSFDEKHYLLCEDLRFGDRLKASAELRGAIAKLLHEHAEFLQSNGTDIWVKLREKVDDPVEVTALTDVLDLLEKIARLGEYGSTASTGFQFHRKLAGVVMALHFAMAVVGGFFVVLFLDFGAAIQDGGMWLAALRYAAPFFGLWLLAMVLIFRGSARGYLVIFDTVLTGAAGFLLVAYGGFYYVNTEMDSSEPQVYQVTVLKKYTTRSRRSTQYHVKTTHWRDEGRQYELMHSYSLYGKVQVGTSVYISVKDGHLGYRWVSEESLMPGWYGDWR